MTANKQGKLTVRDFFENRAESYRRVSRWAGNKALNAKTDEFLHGLSGRIAVDVGAGTGILISRVRNFDFRIALDISSSMLSQIEDNGVQQIVGDIHQGMLADRCADLVICRQLLHYCDLARAFPNIVRLLRPNGWLHMVQVVDFRNVPDSWDQEWASFRNVGERRHQRRLELEECYANSPLVLVKRDHVVVRDEYLWSDFFLKNNIDRHREEQVKKFFKLTPDDIAHQIDLRIDNDGISYNRLFGFWLLRRR